MDMLLGFKVFPSRYGRYYSKGNDCWYVQTWQEEAHDRENWKERGRPLPRCGTVMGKIKKYNNKINNGNYIP